MDLRELSIQSDATATRHPWELARFEFVSSLIRDHVSPEELGNVLDLGCGDIFFIRNFQKTYPKRKFLAVDTAFKDALLVELRKLVENEQILLFSELKDAEQACNEQVKCVLLLDVIEHVQDDVAFLRSVQQSRLIAPNALFVVTAPAYQGLFTSHDRFLGHFRRYDEKTLEATLKAGGLEVVQTGYFFFLPLIYRVFQKVYEWMLGPDKNAAGVSRWSGNSMKTAIARRLLSMDCNVGRVLSRVGIRLPGLSNYAICRVKKDVCNPE